MKVALTLAALLIAGSASTAYAENPNVLFVAIDDLNDWVGCFGGNPQVKAPNFDRLAAEGGIVMMNAHAPATVCCPSRSALLTGVHAHKTGVYGNKNNLKNAPKARSLVTLPEYFSQHGYHSLSMGKIFHRHPLPGDQGNKKSDAGQWAFDEYHRTFGGIGPASKQRPVNGLPNLPNEKPSYHYHAFDWGPTSLNDETEMLDYKTASWAAEQLWTNFADSPEDAGIEARLKALVPQTEEPKAPENPN
jgi:arylsulfatase A-like enzyme